ncbi:hypothetical protein N2152v2_009663 [Parachlorella kessleri]
MGQAVSAHAEAFPVHLLPLDVLEAICAHLSGHDRKSSRLYMACTSCCKALWLREDVLASPNLWGYLRIKDHHCHTLPASQSGPNYSGLLSVAGWVSRHRRGLRECDLFWRSWSNTDPSGLPASLLPITDAMADSSLTTLRINFPCEEVLIEELTQLLPRLPALSHLTMVAGRWQQPLPDQRSALCGLRTMCISIFAAFSGGS